MSDYGGFGSFQSCSRIAVSAKKVKVSLPLVEVPLEFSEFQTEFTERARTNLPQAPAAKTGALLRMSAFTILKHFSDA